MRLVRQLLPAFALALVACNAIFGIEPGVSDGTGGTGGGATSGTASSGSTGGSSSSASSSASTGGGSCTNVGKATCQDAVLQVCDLNGHLTSVTCDAIAACDAVAKRCNDL